MKQPLQSLFFLFFTFVTLACFAGNKEAWQALPQASSSEIKMLSSFLYSASGAIADGNRVVFDTQYSNAVDGNDAIKLTNPGANFGLSRENRILAIEARQPIAAGDTLFYNMNRLVPQVYKLVIAAQNLSMTTGITCELVDGYLHTRQTLSLRDTNVISIAINTDPASFASNRLMITFKATVIVPVFAFTDFSVVNNNNTDINLQWQVNQELSVEKYSLERSADNLRFSSLNTTLPLYNNMTGGAYQLTDSNPAAGDNFYRIRSVSKSGEITFSDIRKVIFERNDQQLILFPNPAINHTFRLQLQNLKAGKYFIRITNNNGQQIYAGTVTFTGFTFMQTIQLGANVSKGDYNVTLISGDGIMSTRRLIVQ